MQHITGNLIVVLVLVYVVHNGKKVEFEDFSVYFAIITLKMCVVTDLCMGADHTPPHYQN